MSEITSITNVEQELQEQIKQFADSCRQKFDEINSIKKEESNPDFFSGLTMQERFQKLYDGSFERHFSKLHDLRKKESYLQNSIGAASTSINCQNNFDGMNLEGKSVSDKLQMLRDGTLEKKVFGE